MAGPGYFQQPPDVLRAERQRAEDIERALAARFERWAELDSRSST
jgi:hypothetical protein